MTERTRHYEACVLPHLDAAYNLARWLMHDDHLAQDMVQEAYLRSFRFFAGFHGDDARPWLLGIVRNVCFTTLKQRSQKGEHLEFDETLDTEAAIGDAPSNDPEQVLIRKLDERRVNQAIAALPAIFREVIVLRELEELSYDDIAQCAGIPVGTVMSRLSRARALLRQQLKCDR